MKFLPMVCLGLIMVFPGTTLLAAPEEKPDAKKAAPEVPPQKPPSTTPPDMANVVYGSDKKFNVFDFWKAKSDKPTPLVIFIHGGGFGRPSANDSTRSPRQLIVCAAWARSRLAVRMCAAKEVQCRQPAMAGGEGPRITRMTRM